MIEKYYGHLDTVKEGDVLSGYIEFWFIQSHPNQILIVLSSQLLRRLARVKSRHCIYSEARSVMFQLRGRQKLKGFYHR